MIIKKMQLGREVAWCPTNGRKKWMTGCGVKKVVGVGLVLQEVWHQANHVAMDRNAVI